MLVIGVKGERYMKEKTTYSKAPNGISEAILSSERIDDFLPPPTKVVSLLDTFLQKRNNAQRKDSRYNRPDYTNLLA